MVKIHIKTMGLLLYLAIIKVHSSVGGKAIYWASALIFPGALYVLITDFSFIHLGLEIFNFISAFIFFFILGRLDNPILYVLFAVVGYSLVQLILFLVSSVVLLIIGVDVEALIETVNGPSSNRSLFSPW